MYSACEDRIASWQSSRGDPRVTRVGAFLRRHSLDELPSVVFKRAARLHVACGTTTACAFGTTVDGQALNLVVSGYMARHRMKPGLTGLAQISGYRGQLDTVEKALGRVECDLYYIKNCILAS